MALRTLSSPDPCRNVIFSFPGEIKNKLFLSLLQNQQEWADSGATTKPAVPQPTTGFDAGATEDWSSAPDPNQSVGDWGGSAPAPAPTGTTATPDWGAATTEWKSA